MIDLSSNIFVYRPVGQVFDFISKAENDFQWQYGTLASAQISEGAIGVGTFFRSIGHFMGRRSLSTFEITDYEPDNKYAYKSLSGPMNSQTFYTFERASGGTKINMSTHASMVDLFPAKEGMLKKALKKQLLENLALLKDILEAA